MGKKKTRKNVTNKNKFMVLAELFNNRSVGLIHLVDMLDFSGITIRRILREFRKAGIIQGRLGNIQLFNLVNASEKNLCIAGKIRVGIDLHKLKHESHWTEEKLYAWIKAYAQDTNHKGKIIVDEGEIFVNKNVYRLEIRVYASDAGTFFEFYHGMQQNSEFITKIESYIVQILR